MGNRKRGFKEGNSINIFKLTDSVRREFEPLECNENNYSLIYEFLKRDPGIYEWLERS